MNETNRTRAERALELHAIGIHHRDRDEWVEALHSFEAARNLEEQAPEESRNWWDIGMSLHEIAWVKAALGFPEEACEYYRLAYEAKDRTPAGKRNWNWFSSTLHELGSVQAKLGMKEEAVESFKAAIQANRNIEDDQIRQRADVASLHALAHLYIELEAWVHAVEATTLEIAILDAPSLVARELYWRTYAYVELEQWELANASAQEALEIYQQIPVSSRDQLHFSQLLEELAGLARQRGERDAAAKLFREARTERRKMQ